MSFQVAYVPIGVGTFHLESAQDQFEKSVAMLKGLNADCTVPEKMLLTIGDLDAYLDTLNPDLIVINSSFTTYFPDLARTLEKSLNNRMGRPLKIRPSHLQDTAILLGGIYVVLKEFLKVENLRLKPAVTENDM